MEKQYRPESLIKEEPDNTNSDLDNIRNSWYPLPKARVEKSGAKWLTEMDTSNLSQKFWRSEISCWELGPDELSTISILDESDIPNEVRSARITLIL